MPGGRTRGGEGVERGILEQKATGPCCMPLNEAAVAIHCKLKICKRCLTST